MSHNAQLSEAAKREILMHAQDCEAFLQDAAAEMREGATRNALGDLYAAECAAELAWRIALVH